MKTTISFSRMNLPNVITRTYGYRTYIQYIALLMKAIRLAVALYAIMLVFRS